MRVMELLEAERKSLGPAQRQLSSAAWDRFPVIPASTPGASEEVRALPSPADEAVKWNFGGKYFCKDLAGERPCLKFARRSLL